jgi:hypothetical protein
MRCAGPGQVRRACTAEQSGWAATRGGAPLAAAFHAYAVAQSMRAQLPCLIIPPPLPRQDHQPPRRLGQQLDASQTRPLNSLKPPPPPLSRPGTGQILLPRPQRLPARALPPQRGHKLLYAIPGGSNMSKNADLCQSEWHGIPCLSTAAVGGGGGRTGKGSERVVAGPPPGPAQPCRSLQLQNPHSFAAASPLVGLA